MPRVERNGKRKTRDQMSKRRVPELGYYFIVTDTKETEQNYMLGLRDSIPKELQGKLVIKVVKTATKDLVDEALNLASLYPQFGEIWIVFDRDQVKNFDEIIRQACDRGISVVLQELIEKIEIFNVEGKGKNRTQRLIIHYRFVGCIDLPSVIQKHTYKLDSRQGVAIEYLPTAI